MDRLAAGAVGLTISEAEDELRAMLDPVVSLRAVDEVVAELARYRRGREA